MNLNRARLPLILIGLASLLAGCQSIPSAGSLLKTPVRFAALFETYELGKYAGFTSAIAEGLNRSVAVDGMVVGPGDIPVRMFFGTVDFAFVPASHIRTAWNTDLSTPFLAMTGKTGQEFSRSVFLVREDSPINGLGDLVGKNIAFGPAGDMVSHLAAVHALRRAGVEIGDLESATHALLLMNDPLDNLKTKAADFGVIDEARYAELAEDDAHRTATRVIGHSTPVPAYVILVRSAADPQMVNEVRRWLLDKSSSDPEINQSLRTHGIKSIDSDSLKLLYELWRIGGDDQPESSRRDDDSSSDGLEETTP